MTKGAQWGGEADERARGQDGEIFKSHLTIKTFTISDDRQKAFLSRLRDSPPKRREAWRKEHMIIFEGGTNKTENWRFTYSHYGADGSKREARRPCSLRQVEESQERASRLSGCLPGQVHHSNNAITPVTRCWVRKGVPWRHCNSATYTERHFLRWPQVAFTNLLLLRVNAALGLPHVPAPSYVTPLRRTGIRSYCTWFTLPKKLIRYCERHNCSI